MMMMMKKEHKDAELDKKIEALRKKNEALMKRYQVRSCLKYVKNTHQIFGSHSKIISLVYYEIINL